MTSYIKLFGLLAATVLLFYSCKKNEEYVPDSEPEIIGEYTGTLYSVNNNFIEVEDTIYGFHFEAISDTTIINQKQLVVSQNTNGNILVKFSNNDPDLPELSFEFTPSGTREYEYHYIDETFEFQDSITININATDKHIKFHRNNYNLRIGDDKFVDLIEFEGWKQ
ncbi:MAG: hypothetical protein JNK77_04335 [Saprospiraceae bacterium]|nr:hypothetical protein [Saprospiraceae bacterium]